MYILQFYFSYIPHGNYYRFNSLLPYQSPQKLDKLSEAFTECQWLANSDIPHHIWERAVMVEEEEKTYHRMDILWSHLSTVTAPDSTHRFARLAS